MNFRGKEWLHEGNYYRLVGTQIKIYQWNSGKKANFAVEAGYRISNHIYKSISGCGQLARDAAINFALSIKDEYKIAE